MQVTRLINLDHGGDDRIRTCDGLLTHNGLANRRLQPLGHISAPEIRAKNYSNPWREIVKATGGRSAAIRVW